MVLNALVDLFCHNLKKCGTERVNQETNQDYPTALDAHMHLDIEHCWHVVRIQSITTVCCTQ